MGGINMTFWVEGETEMSKTYWDRLAIHSQSQIENHFAGPLDEQFQERIAFLILYHPFFGDEEKRQDRTDKLCRLVRLYGPGMLSALQPSARETQHLKEDIADTAERLGELKRNLAHRQKVWSGWEEWGLYAKSDDE